MSHRSPYARRGRGEIGLMGSPLSCQVKQQDEEEEVVGTAAAASTPSIHPAQDSNP